MGDFNEVVCGDEKMGGNGICRRRVEEYTSCMNFCNLSDLGFTRPKFTQTNKRDLPRLIQGRLDRVWTNPECKSCFPEALVKHLAYINSDHCPLLLSLNNPPNRFGERPSRFQLIWLSHERFPPIVKEAQEGNQKNIRGAINIFTHKTRNWKVRSLETHFGRKETSWRDQ